MRRQRELVAELDRLTARLAELSVTHQSVAEAPGPVFHRSPGASARPGRPAPRVAPQPPGGVRPPGFQPPLGAAPESLSPLDVASFASSSGRPAAPPQPQLPFWERPGMVARLLGGAGIGVTLIGIALLLSLAWQYGYFGPPLQLAAATLLGSLLVGGGFWVRHRDASNAGSVALVATGVATGYLTAFMASAFYEYLPASAGMALAAALALSGLAVAAAWRQQWLAAPVLFWVILLIPAMGAPDLLAAVFVLALVTASAGITGNQAWLAVRISEVIPTAGVLLALTGPSLP